MDLHAFRLVVRGATSEGQRVRRVRTVQAPSYEQAWADFADQYEDMSDGLVDVAYSVLPPVGWRVDGSPSAGWRAA